MKTTDQDDIIFSTGKRLNANCDIVGISLRDDLRLYEGYDGYLYEDYIVGDYKDSDLVINKEEAIELCNHMIDVWNKKLASLGTKD